MAATFKSGALIGTGTPALSGWRERVPVIIGVFVVVIFLPWFQLFGPGHVQILGTAGVSMTRVLVFSITYMWAQTLFVLILVFFWERRSLASLGIRMPSGADLGWAVSGYLLVMLGPLLRLWCCRPRFEDRCCSLAANGSPRSRLFHSR